MRAAPHRRLGRAALARGFTSRRILVASAGFLAVGLALLFGLPPREPRPRPDASEGRGADVASLAGLVVENERGIPLVGAAVVVEAGLDAAGAPLAFPTRTDADGRFRVEGIGDRDVAILVTFEGFEPQRLSLHPPFPEGGVSIALDRGGSLAGVVHDPTGAPAADALVVVHGAAGVESGERTARTDARGGFSIRGLPRIPLLLEARLGTRRGFHPDPVTPDADGIRIVLDDRSPAGDG